MNYQEQLKDARWKRKRLKVLQYADHSCQICGAQNVSLQVHHSYYINGAMAWEYPDGSLVALCDDCHGKVIHGVKKTENNPVRSLDGKDVIMLSKRVLFDIKTPVSILVIARKIQYEIFAQGFGIGISDIMTFVSKLIDAGALVKVGCEYSINPDFRWGGLEGDKE